MNPSSSESPIVDPLTELAEFDTQKSDTRPTLVAAFTSFVPSLLGGEVLANMPIPKRERQMGTWMRRGDLGFIFGVRGQGKTWFALTLALSLARGESFGPWVVPKTWRVLYIDGEMPLEDLRDRALKLGGIPADFSVLSHDQHFTVANSQLNLASPEDQARLVHTVTAADVDVVVIDNLSCLFGGVRENDADEWEKVLPWLMRLRQMKVTVIVMHHANRAGQEMRGTSRREDAAFWVLRLVKEESPAGDDKTRFSVEFTKNRQGDREDGDRLLWTLEPKEAGQIRLRHEAFGQLESLVRLVSEGVTANKELAEQLGTSASTVTRLAQAAKQRGLLKVEKGKYHPVS